MPITDEKYVLLTTYRKSGAPVSTPVWIASLPGGAAGFTTEESSGKVRRIRADARVTLQPCSMRGKVRPGAATVEGTAEVLLGAEAAPVRAAIASKYWIVMSAFKVAALFQRLLRRPVAPECAVRIALP